MKRQRGKRRFFALRIAGAVGIGILLTLSVVLFEHQINILFGWTSGRVVTLGGALNVHFIDVGQGDACVIEFPDGKTALIDAGENMPDVKKTVRKYIDANIRPAGKKITFIDYVILTHPDSDHCGAMADILTAFPAKHFYRPNVLAAREGYVDPGADALMPPFGSKTTKAYQTAIEAGYAHAESVHVNFWTLDPIAPEGVDKDADEYYSLAFYGPSRTSYGESAAKAVEQYTDWNNYSPILLLEYAGERMALTGDAEAEAQQEFVSKAAAGEGKYGIFDGAFSVGVLKAGHHGSSNGTTQELLDVLTTESSVSQMYVIVSCGKGNRYGHPHAAFLNLLLFNGIPDDRVLRTDMLGSIVMSIRIDPDTGQAHLHRGTPVTEPDTIAMRWLYAAVCIYILVFTAIVILPSVGRSKE